MEHFEEDGKLIFSPQVARYLLRKGFMIIDIKPDRRDTNKSVFIFRFNEGILDAIQDYKTMRQ